MPPGPNIALLYDDSAYTETLQRPRRPPAGGPVGLMGRQVAGKEFLDAYLNHGTWDEMVALVRNRASAETLIRLCREHPSSRMRRRRLRVVEEREFHDRFFPDPPARLLYTPSPPDVRYAWARQHGGPGTFALCGVTHTLCSAAAVKQLGDLVTGPYEPFDALICTSRAVAGMVRAVTGAYAGYLKERHGGSPGLRLRLETIPLGVDPEKFRPATAAERATQRRALGVTGEEVAVLFVGRLSHHAKAHPFPMYHGLAQAARATGRKVHLILAGWAAHPAVHQAFAEGARVFAPGVRVSVVDGTRADVRFGVWRAADLFTSLSDNIQETFGLVIIEAMASGLAVVASDWNGYRDLVVPGETGLLVPTLMVRDAAASATSRLILGEISYDLFLAECSQTAVVDPQAAAEAFTRLIRDDTLRQAMGAAGRERAVEQFAWSRVIGACEALWLGQEEERRTFLARPAHRGPARYPALEHSFAGYPTRWLGEGDRVQAVSQMQAHLPRLLALPLTSHAAERRVRDATLLQRVLAEAAAPRTLAELDEVLQKAGAGGETGRATLGWLLKYGLLEVVEGPPGKLSEKGLP